MIMCDNSRFASNSVMAKARKNGMFVWWQTIYSSQYDESLLLLSSSVVVSTSYVDSRNAKRKLRLRRRCRCMRGNVLNACMISWKAVATTLINIGLGQPSSHYSCQNMKTVPQEGCAVVHPAK